MYVIKFWQIIAVSILMLIDLSEAKNGLIVNAVHLVAMTAGRLSKSNIISLSVEDVGFEQSIERLLVLRQLVRCNAACEGVEVD